MFNYMIIKLFMELFFALILFLYEEAKKIKIIYQII